MAACFRCRVTKGKVAARTLVLAQKLRKIKAKGGDYMSVKQGQRIKVPEIKDNLLGKVIRRTRLQYDWSIDDLSKKTGVPRDEVSRIETGATKKPSYESITKLGLALGWEPNKIASMTGMWDKPVESHDERIDYLLATLKRLSARDRERLTDQIYMATKLVEGYAQRDRT